MQLEQDDFIDEKAKGAPNWMTTFADLMSLLMCFFVLLLSFSVMDAQKFKQIAGSMKVAFGVQSQVALDAIPKGTSFIATEFSPGKPEPSAIDTVLQHTTEQEQPLLAQNTQDNDAKLKLSEQLKTELEQLLHQELNNDLVAIEMLGQQLIIRLNERGSFSSGSSYLQPQFKPIIHKIGHKLSTIPGRISVAGHTDNLQVNNELHASNWELSAKRAAAVLHTLESIEMLNTKRIKLEAYADTQPLEPHTSTLARAKNRRVEITISQGNAQEVNTNL